MGEQTGYEKQVHYEELYRNMIQEMEMMHKDNLQKLKIGFKSLIIVPSIFLIALFFTGSSKTVFLVLWIVSMFIIALVLVRIEYSDYQLQGRINRATDREGEEATSLMQESIETNRNAMHDLLMREESRLPFKFGFEDRIDGSDEAEYDTDGEALYQDTAEAEPYYSGDAMPHDEEDYEFSASGLTEDDDFIHDADYYDIDDIAPANYDGETISVIDDDVDSIDTLLSGEDTEIRAEPVRETVTVPDDAAAQYEQALLDDIRDIASPSGDDEYDILPFGDEAYDGADAALPQSEALAPAAGTQMPNDDKTDASPEDKPLVTAIDDEAYGEDDDALPAGMTIEDILSEYHQSQIAADYEADFSDFEDYGFSHDDLPDTLGGLTDESLKDEEI